MRKISMIISALLMAFLVLVGVQPAQAARANVNVPVLTIQGDASLPLADVAADWSKRTGVSVVVGDCTGQPECITVEILPGGVAPCGNLAWDGCARDNQEAQTCSVTIKSTVAQDYLTLLYVIKHEAGHCIWAIGPATPWYGHLANDNAIMYQAMLGYPQQYNDTVLTKYDRDWSRHLFGL